MEGGYEQQFKKGALEMVLLARISIGKTYGYELISLLNTVGAPLFSNIREGTLYPVLYRLEDDGLVQSEFSDKDGRRKKYYAVTEAGRQQLLKMYAFWDQYKTCVDRLIEEDGYGSKDEKTGIRKGSLLK